MAVPRSQPAKPSTTAAVQQRQQRPNITVQPNTRPTGPTAAERRAAAQQQSEQTGDEESEDEQLGGARGGGGSRQTQHDQATPPGGQNPAWGAGGQEEAGASAGQGGRGEWLGGFVDAFLDAVCARLGVAVDDLAQLVNDAVARQDQP